MRRLAVLLPVFVVVLATDAGAQESDAWTGRDKALHFAAGSTLAAGGYALGALKIESRERRIVSGFGLSLGAAAAKELYDRGSGGDPSLRDFTWSAAGAATGATIAWLIDRAIHPRPRAQPRATRTVVIPSSLP